CVRGGGYYEADYAYYLVDYW
nr:immunoglobulin heavy chain junction region [Macaca mulatta]MOW47309.1 immunoglobulin heavy chain junction region [Macaca mulatta]MOW48417.1 immunoglobulin heavy chain junction region [Macaca mulatta]MOW49508.1 immunoglobulin heavy chain junction region [Macaca mulatta]MOW50426.1 immunoglobulin heavy chain junction region [Macaca mulatta]